MNVPGRFLYFLLAAISLVLSGALYYFFYTENHKDLYKKRVDQNLSNEVSNAESNLFEFKKQFRAESALSFNRLFSEVKNPIFVFEKQDLVYWSDHRFSVNHSQIEGFFSDKCIAAEHGIFYVKKTIEVVEGREFQFVCLIPLSFNYGIENKYFARSLSSDIFPESEGVSIVIDPKLGEPYANQYGQYLFSFQFDPQFSYQKERKQVVYFFAFCFLVFFIMSVVSFLAHKLKKNKSREAFFLLFGIMAVFRGITLVLGIPQNFIDSPFFDPRVYASSYLSPSLGDLFINVLLITILIAFGAAHLSKIINIKYIVRVKGLKGVVATSLVILTYLSAYFIYFILQKISFNSVINLDITSEFKFDLLKVMALHIFFCVAIIYFIICHISSKVITKTISSPQWVTFYFVSGSLLYFGGSLLAEIDNILVLNVNAIYFAAITFFNFPRFLKKTNYYTFVYLFTCSIAISIVGAYAIYHFDLEKDLRNKMKLGDILQMEKDGFTEYTLNDLAKKITQDPSIISNFIPEIRPDSITNTIRRYYIPRYLDRYDLDIQVFNQDGYVLYGYQHYNQIRSLYNTAAYRTEFSNIFFINEITSGTNRYVCFVPMANDTAQIGALYLNFTLKKNIPNSIYPSLFVDQKFEAINLYKDYSYAIYQNDRLMYSYGEYTYDNKFLTLFKHEKGYLQETLETENHKHYQLPGERNKNIVISSEKYPYVNIFSNFSFLFLLLVLLMMLMIVFLHYATKNRNESINFSTRIQIYLNFAFFLPLIIVIGIIVSILSRGNKTEIESYYLEKAQSVSINIADDIIAFSAGNLDKDKLTDELIDISKLTQTDINIYDTSGRLITTSQGYLFDNQLLSRLVNPRAYAGILEKNQAKMMLTESVGNLVYNTAYVGIKSMNSGEIIGLVGVPFFSSRYKFEQQAVQVIATILQVFAVIFILLLGLSFFAVKPLTKPLLMIAQKIKKVSLGGKNEPLEHFADDEIGLLVNEYNKMLIKLDESRAALARTEKESAWREMAKQVAHEIKNPLTPMKLALQQLERVLPFENERARKTIRMLLEQVDTLNDITTSFSSFAKMPIPEEEIFEIATVLRKTISLHENEAQAVITTDIPPGEFYVVGDAKLMGRIFTNLILNGIQAVEPGKIPRIKITLMPYSPSRVMIEFKDNGTGIPENIHNKIFVPNFTTKIQGSGIGLAIAKRGIEHSGGSIWFDTSTDKGTKFYIEMPLYKKQVMSSVALEKKAI
jgi:nitrogen fixation/metabolism regulation signal transduction histidine kinase